MLPGSVQSRIAGALAAFALVVTLLSGVFSGNPFGVVVLRALLGAVAFGALGLGVAWVLERFVPELLTLGTAGMPLFFAQRRSVRSARGLVRPPVALLAFT